MNNNRPSSNLSRPSSIRPTSSRMSVVPESIYTDDNVRVIRQHIAPTGESVQLVRPLQFEGNVTSDEIVKQLVHDFDYKRDGVRATTQDLQSIRQAFGTNLTSKLLETYDGSQIVVDNQQDLIGERYIAEQIRSVNASKTSVIDRYAHLLYEGEKDDQSHVPNPLEYSRSALNLKPVRQQSFVLNNSKFNNTQQ